MSKKLSIALLATVVCYLSFAAIEAPAQRGGPVPAPDVITKFHIQPNSHALYATVNGTEKKVANEALEAWKIESGRKLVYTASDGPNGPNGLGESVNVYDAESRQHKRIAALEDAIISLKEARSSDGKTALLLVLGSEEGCEENLSVIDPTRGEVFSEFGVRLLSVRGDAISLGYFTEKDWDTQCDEHPKKIKPSKTKSYTLTALLKRRAAPARQPQ